MTQDLISTLKLNPETGNTRVIKKLTILKMLQDKELSCSELSKSLNLSNSGVVGIIDELEKDGFILRQDSEFTFKGRRSISISINPDFGCVASVVLTGNAISVSDMCGNILGVYERPQVTTMQQSDIDALIAGLKALLKSDEIKGRQLLAVSIAAPGKINKNTAAFEFSPFIENYKSVNLKAQFEQVFGVPVLVRNLLQFSFIGEKRYGELGQKIYNTLYVSSLGSALCLNGQLFEGHNGFAGELGLMTIDINNEINPYLSMIKHNSLASACSFSRLEDCIYKALKEKGKFADKEEMPPIEGLIKMYEAGDETVEQFFNTHARIFACALKNVVEFLDLDTVILAGGSAAFGEKYRKIIQDTFDNALTHINAKVFFASVGEEACAKGALYCAIDAALSLRVKVLSEESA